MCGCDILVQKMSITGLVVSPNLMIANAIVIVETEPVAKQVRAGGYNEERRVCPRNGSTSMMLLSPVVWREVHGNR